MNVPMESDRVDTATMLFVLIAVAIATVFNYYLNRAPGSCPDDFRIGPEELRLTCDCYLNTVVVGAIVVAAIALSSRAFDSLTQLVIVGGLAFLTVTAAGFIGRTRRYREWDELQWMLDRVLPGHHGSTRPDDDRPRMFFDDDD